MVKEKMTAIADTIRSHTGKTDKLFLDDMPNEIENACAAEYEKGFTAGQAGGGDGYEEGFEDGKQAEYDRFWDTYQNYGNKTNYDQAFTNSHWVDAILRPKYPLKMEGTNGGRQVFTGCTTLTEINVPIYAKNTRLIYTFNNCTELKTIALLHMDGVTDFSNCFFGCDYLQNITIGGSIEKNISLAQSTKLNKASIESIMEALSLTATGQTLTLSKTAVDNAFHDPEGEDVIGSASADWNSLMESKPNWTITLV